MNRRELIEVAAGGAVALLAAPGSAADAPSRQEVAAGLRRAVEFFRTRAGVQGGYVWQCSDDLSRREGEEKVGPATAWVQPPGTPAVGMALLDAYEATKDDYYREAAQETARALVSGQLRSGGWDYRIEFDPEARKRFAYRSDPERKGAKNVTTFDDDTTQAALRMLMRADDVLERKDAEVHGAVEVALASLLKAQFPAGGWPQRYDTFPDPAQHPVRPASYPETWSREWPAVDYKGYATFNDRNVDRLIDTLLDAHRRYGKTEHLAAVVKAGDFILRSRLPEPQPAWAQQYNAQMQPAWARKFEPPSVTGGESQSLLRTLLLIYRVTGELRFLEPIPTALEYLRKSRLPDGRLARFYELKTNKPLYFTRDYQLTYDDSDVPTHYAFKISDDTARIAEEFERVKALPAEKLSPFRPAARPKLTPQLQEQARAVLAALDAQGRWVEDGKLKYHGADDPTRRVISSATFIRNVGVLSRYLGAE